MKGQKLITDLNRLYTEPALFEKQFSPDGFEWINYSDHQNAVISFIRKGTK
jgi:1,4-alpha-glucan branching enzyme